ncbi:MAG: Flp family type IVb pilin [Oligoflexia bacterium]|nr:Flp family type IVb pilin [Oligoflexia bacterium]
MKAKKSLKSRPNRLLDQKGQALTEYIALVLLIAVVSIAATKALGGTVKMKLQEARDHINSDITIDGK